jgi:tRNA(Ile)-lysidine synthase
VKRQIEAANVVCHRLAVDVAAHRARHVSLQDAARRARLEALRACAAARGCLRVALGHTADDQAETVLFRIVRGTGLRGLAGIPYQRDGFVRPLLDVRRQEVLAYLRKLRVGFFEDPSNRDPRYTRSRVRHTWLPFLAAENPRVVEALLALAEDARADQPEEALTGLPPLPREVRKTVRRLVLEARGTHLVAAPGGEIEVAYGRPSFRRGRGAAVSLPEVLSPPDGTGEGDEEGVELFLDQPVRWVCSIKNSDQNYVTSEIEIAAIRASGEQAQGPATFALDVAARGLRIRTLRPGDRMRPRGGRGSRKLQDLLVDAKIPRTARAGLPIVVDAAGVILFVPGLRPAEDARPAPGARSWVEIRVR